VITGCRILFTITCKVRVVELSPVPKQGQLIMASNHISHFDPPIISGFFPRRLDWMTMDELFKPLWQSKVFTWLNCIPVNRTGADRNALRSALQRLSDGRAIGIFPEGGIRAGAGSVLFGAAIKPGLAALSIHSGAPIIPCLLIGSDRLYKPSNWLRRTTLFLLIGKSIVPNKDCIRHIGARELFSDSVSSSFTVMREEAVARFGLSSEDLPQTPQSRKGNSP